MKTLIPLVAKLRVFIGTVALAVLLLIALLLFLHSQTSVQAAVVAASDAPLGNTIRIQSPVEPSTLDPVIAAGVFQIRVIAQVFEGLVRLDENFGLQPALASAWSYSADYSVYTFTLREAYFTNGRRVVATDVVTEFSKTNVALGRSKDLDVI